VKAHDKLTIDTTNAGTDSAIIYICSAGHETITPITVGYGLRLTLHCPACYAIWLRNNVSRVTLKKKQHE